MKNIRKHDYQNDSYCVWLRPGAGTILSLLSKFNNVHLLTRSTQDYVDDLMTGFGIESHFKIKKYRESCGECKDLKTIVDMDRSIHIDRSILIDDLKSNNCVGQNFYHIPRYTMYVKHDYEMVKLFLYILWINLMN